MPNWCNGVLKVRGKKKDLLKFLNEQLERRGFPFDDLKDDYSTYDLNVETDEFGDIFVEHTDEEHFSWLYFKDSRRCFVETDIDWHWNTDDEVDLEEEYIQCLDIKQAWRLEPDYFKEISLKYNIDFKTIGIEKGCCFSQKLEIVKGEIISYLEGDYETRQEFEWEVYDPRLGG